MIFLCDIISVYGAADAVNKNGLITDLSQVEHNSLQLKNEALKLSLFAYRRAQVLEAGYNILPSITNPCKNREWCGKL